MNTRQAEIAAAMAYSARISAGAARSSYSQLPWNVFSGLRTVPALDHPMITGGKRASEALYHEIALGIHNAIGQSETLYSTNSLAKRPRADTTSNLPIYPQRPGEQACAYYMSTRTCKFGDRCKFDHPIWVPEGGVQNWKVSDSHTSESLPERPGEPDCAYYLKTQKCKFGFQCKFNHPKDKVTASPGSVTNKDAESGDNSILPERPSEPICAFYAKTRMCKFGANCKFHHPKDLQISPTGQETGKGSNGATDGDLKPAKGFLPLTPSLVRNSKGLAIRLGEIDCSFYLKTGSCKYGATCRFNHPEMNSTSFVQSINPPAAVAVDPAIIPRATSLPLGIFNASANLIPYLDPRLTQASLTEVRVMYPQRPGQTECDFYMKNGQCKFGERCKFHHPVDRSAPSSAANRAVQQNVKLSLAGLPRREGAVACDYYMKTGACKYGAMCKFDHPPPGEAVAMAAVQGSAEAET